MFINFDYILQVSIKTIIMLFYIFNYLLFNKNVLKESGVMEPLLSFGFAGKMTNFHKILYSCTIRYENGSHNWYFVLLST